MASESQWRTRAVRGRGGVAMASRRLSCLGKFRVGVNFLHIIVFFENVDQLSDRGGVFDGHGNGRDRSHLRDSELVTLRLDLFVHGLELSGIGNDLEAVLI